MWGCPAGARGMGEMGGLAADFGRGEATAVPARHEDCWRIHVEAMGVDAGVGVPRPNPVKPKKPAPVPIGLTSLAGVVGEVL